MSVFTPDYEYAITAEEIAEKWPKLNENQNFHFTSRKTAIYNCVSWALDEHTKLQICMFYFGEKFGIPKEELDHSIEGYSAILIANYGFLKCSNSELEEGFEKVALYADANGDFSHIARQLIPSGTWTSKMGRYEDIEHYDLECLSGDFYGSPKVYLKRQIFRA